MPARPNQYRLVLVAPAEGQTAVGVLVHAELAFVVRPPGSEADAVAMALAQQAHRV
jgi:hypothetical protein